MTKLFAKYPIRVFNSPTINIDNRQATVSDWFDDTSFISCAKESLDLCVISDEKKGLYTLSIQLYQEAESKKLSDFIAYTIPIAVRGDNDDSLIAQLQERFDQDFIKHNEIIIDLSCIDSPGECSLIFTSLDDNYIFEGAPKYEILHILRSSLREYESTCSVYNVYKVNISYSL